MTTIGAIVISAWAIVPAKIRFDRSLGFARRHDPTAGDRFGVIGLICDQRNPLADEFFDVAQERPFLSVAK